MIEHSQGLIRRPEEVRFKFNPNDQLVNAVRTLLSLEGNTWLDRRPDGLQFVSEYAHKRLGNYSGTIDEMQDIAEGYQSEAFQLAIAARLRLYPSTQRIRLGINVRLPENKKTIELNQRIKHLDDSLAPHGNIKLFVVFPPHSLSRIPMYSSERLFKNMIAAKEKAANPQAVTISPDLYHRIKDI